VKKIKTLRPAMTVLALGIGAGLGLFQGTLHAADYPAAQAITVVVPFSAGGGADNAARIIAKALGEVSGQTVVVDNKAGASGAIGAALVARAKADGYTVLYDASSFAINPALRKLPYDPAKDFIAVSQAISVPNILVAAPSSPYNSLADFMNAARQKPGRLTYASYGPGSLAQMATELLKADAKFDAVHVPYRGGAPAIVDVMGGQVDLGILMTTGATPLVQQKKLEGVGVTSAQRIDVIPEVMSFAEAPDLKGFELEAWTGLFAPARTPEPVVSRLAAELAEVLKLPEVRKRLQDSGATPGSGTPATFAQFLKKEKASYTQIVKSANIQVE